MLADPFDDDVDRYSGGGKPLKKSARSMAMIGATLAALGGTMQPPEYIAPRPAKKKPTKNRDKVKAARKQNVRRRSKR